MKINEGDKSSLLSVVFILVSWTTAILLVDPVGDFPLNDDWAYGQSVKNLLETGRLRMETWMAMTLVTQVLWGALFCLPFGFSFTALRISTLVLGLAGVLATFGIVKRLSHSDHLALTGSLILAFNPWYFSLSYSFMTDVPFLAFFLLSNYAFLHALHSGRKAPVIWGTLLAMAATLLRQFGLLAPLGFGVAYVWQRPKLRSAILGILPLFITIGSLLLYIAWLENTLDLPEGYGRPSMFYDRLMRTDWVAAVERRGGIMLFYWGIFLLPVLLYLLPFGKKPALRERHLWMGALSAPVLVYLAWKVWDVLPIGNQFYDFGLGPLTLKKNYAEGHTVFQLGTTVWTILKTVGFASAWAMIVLVLESLFTIWKSVRNGKMAFRLGSLAMLGAYGVYLLADYHFWDRYLLVGLPLLIFGLLPNSFSVNHRKWTKYAGNTLIAMMAFFSIAGTHDYLAWNRARWQAIEELNASGIDAGQLDGGFEYNAWLQPGPRRTLSNHGKSWWYVAEDWYVIAFEPIDCYQKKKAYPYYRMLPPGRDSILVLHRPALHQVDTLDCNAEKRTADGSRFLGNQPEIYFGGGKRIDSLHSISGNYAVKLTPQRPYGFSINVGQVQPCERFEASVWKYGPGQGSGIAFMGPDSTGFYEFLAAPMDETPDGWTLLRHDVQIPSDYPVDSLSVFIWNPTPQTLWFDDFQVLRQY